MTFEGHVVEPKISTELNVDIHVPDGVMWGLVKGIGMDAKCPKCNNIPSVPDNWQGKQGKCKKCGAAFQIPDKKQGPLPGETIAGVFNVVGGILLLAAFVCLWFAMIATTPSALAGSPITYLFAAISFGMASVLPFGLAAIIQAINANTRQKH